MRQSHERSGTYRSVVAVITLMATVLTFALVRSPRADAASTDVNALLRTSPYLPLFTEENNCYDVQKVNQLTGTTLEARLAQIDSWYVHVHSEGSNNFPLGNDCKGSSSTSLASKLSARGVWASNYRNGSYISQAQQGQVNFSEAEIIERDAPLAIGTFWPGNWKPYIVVFLAT